MARSLRSKPANSCTSASRTFNSAVAIASRVEWPAMGATRCHAGSDTLFHWLATDTFGATSRVARTVHERSNRVY
jgi:hypothetical protein